MSQAKITINGIAGSNPDLPIGTLVQLDNQGDGFELTFLWVLNYQPPGPGDSLSNVAIHNPTITPKKEGTYLLTLIVDQGLPSEKRDTAILGIRHLKTRTRIPAIGESTETGATTGWGQDENELLATVDAMRADPGIQVCALASNGLGPGLPVAYVGSSTIKSGLPGQEDVLSVDTINATTLANTSQPLGLLVAQVAGGAFTAGALVYVRRFGLQGGIALPGANVGDPIYLSDVGSISLTPGTVRRRVGRVVKVVAGVAEIYFDGGGIDDPTGVGDWSGHPKANSVDKIKGATVPATPGAPDAGKVLKVAGAAVLSYGLIVNANIDAAAAIVGTKIDPNFGSQNIQTTGGGTVGTLHATSTVTLDSVGGSGAGLVGTNNTGQLGFVSYASVASTLVLAGDVTGVVSANTVVDLTGAAGVVTVTAPSLLWRANVASPSIRQAQSTSGQGQDATFAAQAAKTGSLARGGDLHLDGGAGDGAGRHGRVVLDYLASVGTGYAAVDGSGQLTKAASGIPNATTLEIAGGVGNGIADDAPAYTAAIATTKTILLGAGEYLTTAGYSGSLAAGQSLIGVGGGSRITNLSNQPIVQLGGDYCEVSNVRLIGTFGAGANNTGVHAGSYSHTIISNVWIDTPGKHGVYVGPSNTQGNLGATISNVRVLDPVNGAGICIDGSQYVSVSNSKGYGGTYGIYIDAGNTTVVGSNFDENTYGLYLNNARGNDGHGAVVACTFNHNQVAVHIEPLINGFDIRSSELYYGAIEVTGGSGVNQPSLVRFKDCDIDTWEWRLNGALVEIDGCKIATANPNTVTLNYGGNASTLIVRPNNMHKSGAVHDFTVNTRWDTPSTRQHEHRFDGIVKHYIDGAHGVGMFGGGGSDTRASLGPVTGNETTSAGLWLLLNATARSAANPSIYSDGTNVVLNSPQAAGLGTIFFAAAGSAVLGKLDASAALFTSYLPFIVSPAGTARGELRPWTGNTADMALYMLANGGTAANGNYSFLSDGTSVWFNSPGAGMMNFYNQNSTQIAQADATSWRFYTANTPGNGPQVEAAHGHIVAGGIGGTEWKTHIGPYPGFETADSCIWFLAPGTSRTGANMALYGNSNNTIINIPTAAQFAGIYGGGDSYYHFQVDSTSTRFMRAGPYTSAYIEHTGHGHIVAGGGNGDWKVHIGPYTSFETSYGAMWSLAPATARSTTNMLFYSDGNSVYFNVPVTGNVMGFVDAAANNIVTATKTYWKHWTGMIFSEAITAPQIYQEAAATQNNGRDFQIQAQNAKTAGAGNGGKLQLIGGYKDGAGTDGPVEVYAGPNKVGTFSYASALAALALTGVLTVGSTPAGAGDIRLRNAGSVYARNNANTQDVSVIYKDTDDFVGVGDTTYAAGIYLNAKSTGVVRLQTVPTFEFASGVTSPVIQQQSNAGATQSLTIRAQASTSGNNNGGSLYIQGGAGNGSGSGGDLHLSGGAGGGTGSPGVVYTDTDTAYFGTAASRTAGSYVASLSSNSGSAQNLISIPIPDETTVDLTITVVGKNSTNGDSFRQNHQVTYSRTGGGAPVIQGTLDSSTAVAVGALGALTSTVTTSSNNVVVQGTGTAGTTVKWSVSVSTIQAAA